MKEIEREEKVLHKGEEGGGNSESETQGKSIVMMTQMAPSAVSKASIHQ